MASVRVRTNRPWKQTEPARLLKQEFVPNQIPRMVEHGAPLASDPRAEVNRVRSRSTHLVALQRALGNREVQRIQHMQSPVVQRMLTGGDKVSLITLFGRDGSKLLKLPAEERWNAIENWIREKGNKKNPPTVQEVIAHLGINTADVVQPAAAAAVVQGMAIALKLIDEDDIEIGLDDHQNKHQVTPIHGLKTYTGGKAGKGKASGRFPEGADAAWHTDNTAETMRTWVTGLNEPERLELDPPGKLVHSAAGQDLGDGRGYVATAMKDSAGKLYGSYHCYPLE